MAKGTTTIDGTTYWMDGLVLMGIPEGEPAILENAFEVTAPDSQETLDKVNAAFGTNYQLADFAGR